MAQKLSNKMPSQFQRMEVNSVRKPQIAGKYYFGARMILLHGNKQKIYDAELPPGYQEIKCHMIFDIKMGKNFWRKAWMVARGHTSETPFTLTYASVVSRDS
eukprot:4094071-Ditylum_brightwellii.AAC.1